MKIHYDSCGKRSGFSERGNCISYVAVDGNTDGRNAMSEFIKFIHKQQPFRKILNKIKKQKKSAQLFM